MTLRSLWITGRVATLASQGLYLTLNDCDDGWYMVVVLSEIFDPWRFGRYICHCLHGERGKGGKLVYEPLHRGSTWCVQVLRSPKEAFAAAMQSCRERCEKCVCLQGDYVEK